MKVRKLITCLFFSFVFFTLSAQSDNVRYSPIDCEIFEKTVEAMQPHKDLPIADLATEIALHFLSTPYVAGTLEIDPEMLTVNLHETDCILFVEMCVAISRTIKNFESPTFSDYCTQVQNMRYRDGIVNGYDSRLHYTSEWIIQNEHNSIVEEISGRYGTLLDQTFSYMSTHPQSYAPLRDSDDMTRRIALIERNLNHSGPYYYITNNKLRTIQKEIRNGDIICFISKVEGLDIAHVALAYWNQGKLHFIHASFKEKKVVIEKKTLVDYATNGIRLVRLK